MIDRLQKTGAMYAAMTVGIFFCFLMATPTQAHPGNTASDGCHYCRTNCSSWGVAWDQRHCHGGSTTVSRPTNNYIPPRQTPAATEMRNVVSQSDFIGNTENEQKDKEDSFLWWLAGGAAGIYGLRKAWKWAFNRQ